MARDQVDAALCSRLFLVGVDVSARLRRRPRRISLAHSVLDNGHIAPESVFTDTISLPIVKLHSLFIHLLVLAYGLSWVAPADPGLHAMTKVFLYDILKHDSSAPLRLTIARLAVVITHLLSVGTCGLERASSLL